VNIEVWKLFLSLMGSFAGGIVTVTMAMIALYNKTVGKTLDNQEKEGSRLAAAIDKLSTTMTTEMTAVRTEISGMKDRLGEQLSDIRVEIAATRTASESMADRIEYLTDAPRPPRPHLTSLRRKNGSNDE
jgi:hypothetical protein